MISMTIKNIIARNLELLLIPLFALTAQSCDHKMKFIRTKDDHRYVVNIYKNNKVIVQSYIGEKPYEIVDSTGSGKVTGAFLGTCGTKGLFYIREAKRPDSSDQARYEEIYPQIKQYLKKEQD